MSEVEVVIIGAGPYGLSAAAHLKSKGPYSRIFHPSRSHIVIPELIASNIAQRRREK